MKGFYCVWYLVVSSLHPTYDPYTIFFKSFIYISSINSRFSSRPPGARSWCYPRKVGTGSSLLIIVVLFMVVWAEIVCDKVSWNQVKNLLMQCFYSDHSPSSPWIALAFREHWMERVSHWSLRDHAGRVHVAPRFERMHQTPVSAGFLHAEDETGVCVPEQFLQLTRGNADR